MVVALGGCAIELTNAFARFPGGVNVADVAVGKSEEAKGDWIFCSKQILFSALFVSTYQL